MRSFVIPALTSMLLALTATPANADMMSYMQLVSDPKIGASFMGLGVFGWRRKNRRLAAA